MESRSEWAMPRNGCRLRGAFSSLEGYTWLRSLDEDEFNGLR
jgi:hypothetical protein